MANYMFNDKHNVTTYLNPAKEETVNGVTVIQGRMLDDLHEEIQSTTVALILNKPYNFSQMIFNFLVKNNTQKGNKKFILYPRFVQMLLDDKVGSSEAALLAKLGTRPFSYGLMILTVDENGSVFSLEALDLTEDDLIKKFALGVSMVTSLALAILYPTIVTAPFDEKKEEPAEESDDDLGLSLFD